MAELTISRLARGRDQGNDEGNHPCRLPAREISTLFDLFGPFLYSLPRGRLCPFEDQGKLRVRLSNQAFAVPLTHERVKVRGAGGGLTAS